MRKYMVVFVKDDNPHGLIVGEANTLQEAKELRIVSGDLVIDSVTKTVVRSTDWLFDWELQETDNYALRAQREGRNISDYDLMYHPY